ncbi:TonB-dependent receptor domain-containing protein [Bacteroidota bacterium]
MKILGKISTLSCLLCSVFLFSAFGQTGTGNISGRISDENGQPQTGATIFIEALTLGTIADANGHYQLLGVPSGKQTVKISFIGYKTEEFEVEISRGDLYKLDVQMIVSTAEIVEVVAYGQARGQRAAINQQLNAKGISNVVSGEKLQELPDVNVAEAIGRLPGMMVERNRGEGQKIIIRGLAPKYNTISIGGHMAPSTSPDDRSTDLNMIAPEILGGVEILKANTAEQDADGLGGTVNLTLREAPTGFKGSADLLTGYSGQSNNLSNLKGSFYVSNRFFNDKLGIMVTGNAETAERNSDKLDVDYYVQGIPDYDAGETFIQPEITGMEVQANIEDRTRAGGSLLMDWKLGPSSTIKSSNFIGYLDRNIYDRVKDYSLNNTRIYYKGYHEEINQLLFSNALDGKHFILGSVLDWGVSRSQSNNEKPYGTRYDFRQPSAFIGYQSGASFDMEAPELLPSPENLQEEIDETWFYESRNVTYDANEVETSFFLNWQTPFRFGDVSGYIKMGAKHRYKHRERTNNRTGRRIDYPQEVRDFLAVYPDYTLTTEGVLDKLQIINFLDEDYVPSSFMNDKYEFLSVNEVLNSEQMADIYKNYLHDWEYIIYSAGKDDYLTDESIQAYYLMTEINIGKYVTFIPGVRYEKTYLNYAAKIAHALPDGENQEQDRDIFKDTTATNNYYNILPQIHLRIKPTSWFDIRLAYTNTLSRADYNQLAPKEIVNSSAQTVNLGNTELKPAASENFDIIFTFYQSRFGLFTVGAFQKNIENFLWTRKALIRTDTDTDPAVLKLAESTVGYDVYYPVNNKNMSTIKGLEFDLQTNLDFLPVKGFVFNANFTIMESHTKYSETLIEQVVNPDYGIVPFAPRAITVNHDTAYADRLLSQPNYLANLGLGYDNRKWGTSVRLSFNFQDDILTREQRRPDGADREATLEFYRWDFQLKQMITKKLSFNANVSNIFNQPDRSVRLITGYYTELEYYGYLAQIGLKYTF